MKKFFLSFLAFAGTIVAQNRSDPFNLIFISDDQELNGTGISTCHEGAAIDGLCISGNRTLPSLVQREVFTHNTSSDSTSDTDADAAGPLLWTWTIGANQTIESALSFRFTLSSNVAHPWFFPAGGSQIPGAVSFDACNQMYMLRQVDDTVVPPSQNKPNQGAPKWPPKKDYHWYCCHNFADSTYKYWTLSWKIGAIGRPQNPTCIKVQVKRVFIEE